MQDYRELKVWQKSHQLALQVYGVTESFPKVELYGLTSQIRRAAVSIPANIVEGRSRDSEGDFKRFLQIAQGSAAELDYEILLAHDLSYLSDTQYRQLADHIQEVHRMLNSFAQALKPKANV